MLVLLLYNIWSPIITTHWLFWLRGPDRITPSVSYTLFLAVLTVPGGSVKIANHLTTPLTLQLLYSYCSIPSMCPLITHHYACFTHGFWGGP